MVRQAAAPKDSLDGILGRATVTEPNPSEKAINRMAAAKASAAANTSKVNASATLPVLAGKVSVNDDPLLGTNAKPRTAKSAASNAVEKPAPTPAVRL